MSRTIVNSSDGLNSWDIEQSTSTATNTGIVETVITGVNESVAFRQDIRTNLITYSEDFSDASWTKSNSSITSNSVISPDGSLNAFKLVESATTATHRLLSNNFSVISGNTYTLSFFIKKGETNFFQILFGSTGFGNTHANFDLNLGEVGDLSGVNASSSITSFANDWYKCTITADSNLTTSSALCIALPISSKTAVRQENYTGDGTSGVYIYGAQVEQQSYATSYIPTSGTAVTVDSNSTSVVNNTGIVERPITGVSDGLNSWDIEQSTGTTNSTTTIRYINPPTIIPNLLSLLQARATYYENVTCTTAILTELENIEI